MACTSTISGLFLTPWVEESAALCSNTPWDKREDSVTEPSKLKPIQTLTVFTRAWVLDALAKPSQSLRNNGANCRCYYTMSKTARHDAWNSNRARIRSRKRQDRPNRD